MAVDNSPPRIGPIFLTAAVALSCLIALKFMFDSYYVTMFEAEEYRKVGSVEPTALLALRAAERKSLAGAPIPLDKAMQIVAKGRAAPIPEMPNGGITPEPSNDESSLVGWAQAPHTRPPPPDVPTPAPATPASAPPPPPRTPAPPASAPSAAHS